MTDVTAWATLSPLQKVVDGLTPVATDYDHPDGVYVEATEPVPTFWAVASGNLHHLPTREVRARLDCWYGRVRV